MLVLTRRCAERLIMSNGKITVTVLGIQGDPVRIGGDVPREVSVHCEEIYQRILNEKDPEASL